MFDLRRLRRGSRKFLFEHDLIRKTGIHSGSCCLANNVRQQTKETRALDGAGEFTLLLGGDGGDAARHDLAALGHVTHQQLGILVVDLRRIRARERARLATAEKRTACTSFGHDSYSSTSASASSRGQRRPQAPSYQPPARSPRKPPAR